MSFRYRTTFQFSSSTPTIRPYHNIVTIHIQWDFAINAYHLITEASKRSQQKTKN